MRRRPARLALAVPVLAGLAACAGPAPVTFGSQEGVSTVQCVHLAQGDVVLIGDVLRAPGGATTIRSVSLKDPRGIRVLQTWLVHNPAGGVSFGVTDVPPKGRTAAQIGWSSRVPAGGARVPARSERNVVLEVQKTRSTTATAAAIRVDAGGTEVDSGTRYVFPARCT